MVAIPSNFVPVPQVTDDEDSLYAAVSAIAQNMAVLTGQQPNGGGGAGQGTPNQVIVTQKSTNAQSVPTGINVGDFWLQVPMLSTQGFSLSVWIVTNSKGAWQTIINNFGAPLVGGLVRQTVLGGPVDATGLPDFLATSGSLVLTEQNVSQGAPMVVSAANGFSVVGGAPLDAIGLSLVDQSWTLPASSTSYLYKGVNPDGSIYAASTTLQPIYQRGGTPSVTAGQFTFDYAAMVGYMGNGSTAAQASIVFVGEAVTSSSAVTSVTSYAYGGRFEAPWTATLPGAASTTSFNHNLGTTPLKAAFLVQCTAADISYDVGDLIATDSGLCTTAGAPVAVVSRRNTLEVYNSATWNALEPGGTLGTLTAASWQYKALVERGW